MEKKGAPIRAGRKNRKMGLEPRPVIEALIYLFNKYIYILEE